MIYRIEIQSESSKFITSKCRGNSIKVNGAVPILTFLGWPKGIFKMLL